jgi:RHS repeat-associated protein
MTTCLFFALALVTWAFASDSDEAGSITADHSASKAPEWLRDLMVSPPSLSTQAKAASGESDGTRKPAELEASRTAFRDLTSVQAVDAARQAFPELVNEPIDPAPELRDGERITGYPTSNTAQLELPDGRRAAVDSLLPLVTTTAEGKEVPVDLTVREGGDALVLSHPLVPVRIPQQLTDGFELPSLGLTLTPTDGAGLPLQGTAAIEGAAVHYANTQPDTDILVKPVPLGFQTHSILRSPASPEQHYFRVEIEKDEDPTLTQLEDGSILVEANGAPITVIPPSFAVDATGTPVPVSTEANDNLLVLTLSHRGEPIQYPIDLDPTAIDFDDFKESEGQHNWVYQTNASSVFEPESVFLWGGSLRVDNGEYPYNRNAYQYGNFASWFYLTQGVSRIYEFEADGGQTWDWGSYWESTADAFISIVGPLGAEGTEWEPPAAVCANVSCSTAGGSAGNAALFELIATQNADNYIGASLEAAYVKIAQDQAATITFNTTDPEIGGKPNALYQSGKWLKASDEARIAFSAADPGLGLSFASLTSPGYTQWSGKLQQSLGGCIGVQCDPTYSVNRPIGNLPDGKRSIMAYVSNAAIDNELTTQVKIDNTGPTIAFSGLGASNITDLGSGKVTVKVTDGTESTESSGVKAGETSVSLDGEEILAPGGEGCSPGPCTITRDYSFTGREIGIGVHTLTVDAVDQVGNERTTEFPFIVQSSGPTVDMGPGQVNLKDGDFALSEADLAESVPGTQLAVMRTHESLRADEAGPLGPGWQLSMGAWRSASKTADGSVVLTDSKGRQVIFQKSGSKFNAPPEYQGWKMSYDAGKDRFTLDGPSGGSTVFQHLSGAPESLYVPWLTKNPDGETTLFQSASYNSGVVKPTMLGSESCVLPELLEPCKWLYFYYDSSTTATGGTPSEWGDYTGRLSSIKLLGWSTEGGLGNEDLEEVTVAEYAYDAGGRLRAAWDPRIAPALKTTYAYDAAGHVTAATPPGQQPWLMRYGSTSGSSYSDWLLSASRAPASSDPGSGEEPENTKTPFLSNRQPIVKTTYSVWNGVWENNPLSYSYQWNRCDSSGQNCVVIAGASSQSYTPTAEDIGHRLIASVTATNAGGSISVAAPPSAPVIAGGAYVSSFGNEGGGSGQFSHPTGVARDSKGHIWVVDSYNNRVQEFNEAGEYLSQFGTYGSGNGQFMWPSALAIDSKDRIWVVDTNNERIQQITDEGEYLREVEVELELGGPVNIAIDSEDHLWVANANNLRLEEFDGEGKFIGFIKPELVPWVVPAGIAVGPDGHLWVADTNVGRVFEFDREGEILTSFGSYGSGNGQFKHPAGIDVDKRGDIWIADQGNERVQKFNASGEYIAQFGTSGSAAGQFNLGYQAGLTVGPGADLWVADAGNDRVQRWLSPPVVSTSSFGSNGSEPGQFKQPYDLAADAGGNVWVADSFNHRLQQFSPTGEFLSQFGEGGSEEGQLNLPVGVTVDAEGDLWTSNFLNHHVQEFSPEGELLTEFGEVGSEPGQLKNPTRIAVDSKGDIWVADSGNDRVQKFSPEGEHLAQFGEEGSEPGQLQFPAGIAIDSEGNLWIVDRDNHRVQKFDDEGEYLTGFGEEGSEPGQLKTPTGISIDAEGGIWVVDSNNHRVQQFNAEGEYLSHFGEEGSGDGQLKNPGGIAFAPEGRVWVADRGNNRVSEWQRVEPGQGAPPPNPATATWTAIYDVPTSGSGAPQDMSASAVAKWAQAAAPTEATAIFPPDQVPGAEPSNYKRATVYYTNEAGQIVNTLAPGGRLSTEEHDQFGNVTRTLTPENRQRALDIGKWQSAAVSKELDSQLDYSESGSRLVSVLGPKHEVGLENGEEVEARLSTKYFYDEGAPEQGGPYGLVTKQTEGALVGEAEHDVRTKTFDYDGQEGLGWELREPTSETVDPGGLGLTSRTLYDADTGNVIETRMPANPEGGDAHATQAIYYTAGESEVEGCGGRPELEGLVCQTRPAAQPETPGLPDLPVTTTAYNLYGQPTVTSEAVGESVRTATIEYDEAGRPLSSHLSSTDGKPLPKVQMLYDEETGLPTVQATETESIVSEYDSLGQLTAYTDADGNTSTFAYDALGRPSEVNDGKGTQTFSYDATTGDLSQVVDSAAGTFSAEHDAGGKITTMALPNGLEARYTYDSGGAATALEYVDTTACSQECTWFEQEAKPSIHGETLSESSTQGVLDYAYDAAGRLVKAEETPQGKGCATRLYSYDADTNRTATTTRGPAEGGACAQSGGETQTNAFDEADRLLGEGIEYDDFGNIIALPGVYAGGKALASTYYADDSAASLSQGGTTIEYMLDPLGREREAVTANGEAETSLISHFTGDSDSPAWTEDGSGNWTRYIGAMGGLTAIQSSTGGLELQIADLGGDIVATAPAEEAEELDFIGDASEYGVPQGEGSPAKYSWLGSAQRSTELDSGVVAMGARTYVPQLGRFLQTDPVPGGSANAYAYVHGDPVGENDLSGEYTPGASAPPWLLEVMENPPGMPPPPPPPPVEQELIEDALILSFASTGSNNSASASVGLGGFMQVGPCTLKPHGIDRRKGIFAASFHLVSLHVVVSCTTRVTVVLTLRTIDGHSPPQVFHGVKNETLGPILGFYNGYAWQYKTVCANVYWQENGEHLHKRSCIVSP